MATQDADREKAPREPADDPACREERWLEECRDELAPLSLSSDLPAEDRPGEMWFEPEGGDTGAEPPHRHDAIGI